MARLLFGPISSPLCLDKMTIIIFSIESCLTSIIGEVARFSRKFITGKLNKDFIRSELRNK